MVLTFRPRTVNSLPGWSGLLNLIVATSNASGASAAIGFGGSGMAHAVSFVARWTLVDAVHDAAERATVGGAHHENDPQRSRSRLQRALPVPSQVLGGG